MCGGGSRVESTSGIVGGGSQGGGGGGGGSTVRPNRTTTGNHPAVYARLSVLLALLSPALLLTAALSPSWLAVRELLRPAVYDVVSGERGGGRVGAVSGGGSGSAADAGAGLSSWHSGWALYHVGLWRACPAVADPATAAAAASVASPRRHDGRGSTFCASMLKGLNKDYVPERESAKVHLEGVPLILSKTGWAVHMVGMSLLQLVGAVLSAIIGHCRQSNLGFFATYFSAMGGMLTGGGLLNIAAVAAEARALPTPTPTPWHRSPLSSDMDPELNPAVVVSYGWPFYAAVAVFFIANLNVYFLARAALSRYESVEAMVRAVVPGADRKLREHQDSALWQVFPGSQRARQLGCIPFGGGGGGVGGGSASVEVIDCYGRANDVDSVSPQLVAKAKPDICAGSNPEGEDLLGGTVEIKSVQRPISPFNDASSGPSAANATLVPVGSILPHTSSGADTSAFAGVSVPITLMRPRPNQRTSHRTIPCNILEDATALDSFPPFPSEPSVASPSTMTSVVASTPPSGTGVGAGVGAGAGGTLQPTRHKSAGVARIPVAHTHTLPHPPRQF